MASWGEVRADKARETFTLAVSIIRHFFGHDWYMDHIFQEAQSSRPNGFMRIDYTPGPKGELKTSRLLDFAENLFNLQHIEGFDDRVEQMRAGAIEATSLNSTSGASSTSTTLISSSSPRAA